MEKGETRYYTINVLIKTRKAIKKGAQKTFSNCQTLKHSINGNTAETFCICNGNSRITSNVKIRVNFDEEVFGIFRIKKRRRVKQ